MKKIKAMLYDTEMAKKELERQANEPMFIHYDLDLIKPKEVEIVRENNSNLRSMYKHIKCDTIDYIDLSNVAKGLGAYVDDEGLLKPHNSIGMVYVNKKGEIVGQIMGNILFTNHNSMGETISLDKTQIEKIKNMEIGAVELTNGEIHPVLVYQI